MMQKIHAASILYFDFDAFFLQKQCGFRGKGVWFLLCFAKDASVAFCIWAHAMRRDCRTG